MGNDAEELNVPKDRRKSFSKSPDNNYEKKYKEERQKREELEIKLKSLDKVEAVQESDETQATLANLIQEIENLKRAQIVQVYTGKDGKKPKYRPVTADDIGTEAVTFTARCVMKVVASYMDENGVEKLPPHKLIHFKFAASDIRQDGMEQDILNFCQYTTKLKSEIEYLRSCPEYRVTFGENMNDVAGHDSKEYQFKVRAAQDIATMSTESILIAAQHMDIPNWQKTKFKDLKDIILTSMVDQYKKEADKLQDDLHKRLIKQAAKAVL